jgi:hypothetical protein
MTVSDGNIRQHFTRSEYVKHRLSKLLTHDKIRFYKIVEIVQYCIIYATLGFFTAILFDVCLPNFNPNISVIRTYLEVMLQLSLFSVSIFYIGKVAKLFPLCIEIDSEYHPYLTEEYVGGIALGIMFLKVQPNFNDKIQFLGKWMRNLSI